MNNFELENRIKELELEISNLRSTKKTSILVKENHYRLMFENSLDGFALCQVIFENNNPTDLIYLEVNKAFKKLTGLQNVIGQKITAILPNIKEKNPELFQLYGSVATTGEPQKIETFVEPLNVWLAISVICPEKGFIIAIFDDITDRKRSEEAIKASKEKFENLIQHSPDIVYKYSNIRGGLFWSNRVKDILGFNPEEIQNNPFLWNNAIHPDDKKAVQKAIEDHEKGTDYDIEYRIKTKSGNWIWLHDYFMHKSQIGDEIIIEGHASNITKRKHAEEELKQSVEQYKNLFEHSGTSIIIIDNEGKYLMVNNKAAQKFGLAPNLIIGKSMFDFLPHQIAQKYLELNKSLISSGGHREYEDTFDMQGKQTTFLIADKCLQDSNGVNFAVQSSSIDITERKLIEKNLKESQEKYRVLFETMTEGIALNEMIYNEKGEMVDYRILEVNEAFYSIADYSTKQVVNNVATKLYGMSAEQINSFWMNHKEKNETQYSEMISPLNNKYFYISTSPFINNRFVTAFFDITKLKQAELIIEQQNEALIKLNADKDRFMSILAHDLKNPFSSILGFSGLLVKNLNTYDTDKINTQINNIYNSAQQFNNLLDDLLNWTRAQSGKLPFNPQKIIFLNICQSIVENLKPSADAKHITISFFDIENLVVFADIDMLKTILRNLVSNAIKFTKREGKIHIYGNQNNSTVTITVSDTGIGIEKNRGNILFDFSQLYTTEGTAKEKGTGLGLLLCKEFVEKHGGKIWVESQEGEGSEFIFTLPLYDK